MVSLTDAHSGALSLSSKHLVKVAPALREKKR